MTECTKQALAFLERANATCSIEFGGCATNPNCAKKELQNFYNITLSTPRGSMSFIFWDSIHNTKISKLTLAEYAKKRFKCQYEFLTYADQAKASKELKEKQAAAVPTVYKILAGMTKYDPGIFDEFCSEFGYDEDSKTTDRIYIAAIKEYKQLERLFTPEQMEQLQAIN